MKDMPLPLELEGKGVFEICWNSLLEKLNKEEEEGGCCVGTEPTSVLDTRRSPSPPTSTSTLSSSCGGGGSDTAGVAAVSGNPSQKWPPAQPDTTSSNAGVELHPIPASVDLGASEKCGLGMEDWESVLSETAASPSQEQSILRWIMGSGFGVVDQGFGFEPCLGSGSSMNAPCPSFPPTSNSVNSINHGRIGPVSNPNQPNFKIHNPQSNPNFAKSGNNLMPISFNQQQLQQQPFEALDEKPQILIPQVLINQHQAQHTQNPAFFLPLPYAQQEQNLLLPPQAKRHNTGPIGSIEQNCPVPKVPFSDSGQELLLGDSSSNSRHKGFLSSFSCFLIIFSQGRPWEAAELVETGNTILAQGILARLNHQLSPIGKPFQRAAFYFKEALQLLLHSNSNNTNRLATSPHSSPFSLIFKIGAYKSFSEISPLIQFANFTCIQAILEALEGFDRIHIIDFDIGYGGQWASLMQELALRNGGAPSLKITAFASLSNHDQLELGLARENLNHFAGEINMAFELEILSLDSLNSLPLHLSENEAVAVNLPVGCDRTDLPYSHHILHAFQSYLALLESLDAVNVNSDALQKIERFLLQPGIEKIVLGRHRSPEKTPPWRTLLLSSGFSPLTFSNFSESQAECLVKRTPVRGFHVEKRQSSLVLCWQRKDLISASAWRC
ncbi:Scarecrow-like protein 6 [Vitis vinifera]|uniref:Scarecrow-like protein 6 n=1 Tax=Vitis vinifera TaxID=29760 RepID=A0A438FU62_VITVI|nr:Scarecrow-like protein 6 [Vitis vinifera]